MIEMIYKQIGEVFKFLHAYPHAPCKQLHEQYLRSTPEETVNAFRRHVCILSPWIEDKNEEFLANMETLKEYDVKCLISQMPHDAKEKLFKMLHELIKVCNTIGMLPPALLNGVQDVATRWGDKMSADDNDEQKQKTMNSIMSDVFSMVKTNMPEVAGDCTEQEFSKFVSQMHKQGGLTPQQSEDRKREFRNKLC